MVVSGASAVVSVSALCCGGGRGREVRGTVGVVQGKQFPVRAQCLVGSLPEVAGLLHAAGLSVADGSDRHAAHVGESRLSQASGAAARGAGSGQGPHGIGAVPLSGRGQPRPPRPPRHDGHFIR